MFATYWLAALLPPVFATPLPQAPDVPAALAVASDRVDVRLPCYRLRCPDSEWQAPLPATTYAIGPEPVRVQRTELPGQRGAIPALHVAISPRTGTLTGYSSDVRVGARYGIDAVRTPDTRVRVEVGSGYRMQPSVDDGIPATGMVARGKLEWQQQLTPRAQLTQQVRVETGRGDTYLRNAVGVDVQVLPQWLLRSSVETRHDSAAQGGQGATETAGSVQLRYAF